MTRLFSLLTFAAVLVTTMGASIAIGPTATSAQSREAVSRIAEFGRMPPREAQRVARVVTEALRENAAEETGRFDRVRGAVGQIMFRDGPGRTRQQYEERLGQVRDRMRAGLDEEMLAVLFAPRRNASVLCATDYALTISDCDALVAAAQGQPTMLPYVAPDAGRDLARALRTGGAGRHGREITSKLRAGMLGVPRNLSRDSRGREMIRLLERCPGALTTRESQVRAWHVGPTEGMARCIASTLARGRSLSTARSATQSIFDMSAPAAEAYLTWAVPRTEAAAPAPEPEPATVSASDLINQARAHYGARRYREAAGAYQQVTTIDPTNARAFAGLGSSLLRARNARGAIAAFENANALRPGNASVLSLLGHAYAASRDADRARSAYQRALAIQPQNPIATQGLARLPAAGAAPPTRRPPPAQPAAPQVNPATSWQQQGSAHFQAGRFREAATAYEQALSIDGTHGPSLAGLGAARMRLGDPGGAVRAYQGAVRVDGSRSNIWSSLAQAQAQTGDRASAMTSLQRALQLDPNNQSAQQGIASLSSGQPTAPTTAPPRPSALPDSPARDEIMRIMRPLRGDLVDCAPGLGRSVRFSVTVVGADGTVVAVTVEDSELDGTDAGQCMEAVIHGALFPPFSRPTLEIAYPYSL